VGHLLQVRLGADLHSLGEGAATPLHDAASMGQEKVVIALLHLGSDVGARTHDGLCATLTPFATPTPRCPI